MLRWIRGRLVCFTGKHARSVKHIKFDHDGAPHSSRCAFCGTTLIRRRKRDWIVEAKAIAR